MDPFNISFLSFRVIFHLHFILGRKGKLSMTWSKAMLVPWVLWPHHLEDRYYLLDIWQSLVHLASGNTNKITVLYVWKGKTCFLDSFSTWIWREHDIWEWVKTGIILIIAWLYNWFLSKSSRKQCRLLFWVCAQQNSEHLRTSKSTIQNGIGSTGPGHITG